jgi:hypothetical protein
MRVLVRGMNTRVMVTAVLSGHTNLVSRPRDLSVGDTTVFLIQNTTTVFMWVEEY